MAEQIQADEASWNEVGVTLIFTGVTSAFLLSVFELARRNSVLQAVFDRRRKLRPHRTPPPLIRHSLLEWLFLSNEMRYSEYSDLSHMKDVLQERRRQRIAAKKKFKAIERRANNGSGGGLFGFGSQVCQGKLR